MENSKPIPDLEKITSPKKLPANYVCWQATENVNDDYQKVNSSFFQATEYPLLRFFKNITKSLPLDEMDKKI